MTSLRKPIPRERFLQLDWSGPYLLREGSLSEHPAEPQELPEETAGLYLVTSDFPLRGNHSLTYIGETNNVRRRFPEHDWLQWEWRLELYVAPLDDPGLRKDAENLLIRSHMPPANSQHIGRSAQIEPPLRIWNFGRCWGLFPEVSSEHEWNK